MTRPTRSGRTVRAPGPPQAARTMVVGLRRALEEVAEASDAPAMAAYLKDQFPFLGVKAGPRRTAARPFMRELAGVDADAAIDMARHCWREPEREFQYVGTDLLARRAGALEERHLGELRWFVETKSWWDTVDALASHVVGALVHAHRHLAAEMDRWVVDDNLWVARTAILHQLRWKQDTDAERLFRYTDQRSADTAFFIRKALGWALREYAKTDPEAVRSYVAAKGEALSGLTRREALKNL